MIEYKVEKNRIFFMGSELVSFYVSYPEIEGKERLNSFFGELASNSVSWASGELLELARREYEESHQAPKPYRYALQMLADSDGAQIRVSLSASLCRGRNQEIKKYEEEILLDTDNQLIKKRQKEKKRSGA